MSFLFNSPQNVEFCHVCAAEELKVPTITGEKKYNVPS